MLALTFFSVLHVPINIPALALITGEDNADLDRELRAHGWSNTLSGLCGSVQVRFTSMSVDKSFTNIYRTTLYTPTPFYSCEVEEIVGQQVQYAKIYG